MKLVRDLDHTDLCPRGSAVTIGNFDGLHRGHGALLGQARAQADSGGLAMAVVTFEPLSREYFSPAQALPRVYSASERLRILARYRPDVVWMARFNAALAAMTAEAFVERILVRGLNARQITVGDDFRFGRGRAGDQALLRQLGSEHGFDVWSASTVVVDGRRVSSTAVREALAAGRLDLTERLLGRPYAMYGRVVRGSRLGHRLGYPTANMRLNRGEPPLHGIFAVTVDGPGLQGHKGVASVGCRPTVTEAGAETLLEVHLFDFDGDLYGSHLEVTFVAKLRDEEKFADLDALIAQMHRDAAQARAMLAA